ncbi:hypothetical protein G5V57_30720 [Nordella sp. HKS 07]|uniref:hypothetical protein n=1 Tax=Nordella sp. HKS 07 TaxID=2712222 RepID=UPI0013E0FE80|nr:hypothetical protein [Nordella sp. HKS 07]QIG51705.1 hypothetical protein G5V57_30720 [Nordella sp. HKS 07]
MVVSPRTIAVVSCDGGAEAARLVADGCKLGLEKEALVKALYETEPGRNTHATLRPWWKSVTTLSPGSVIQICYSRASPNEAELVTGAEKVAVVILGFLLGALVLACLIAVITYEGDEQATSG